MPVEVRRVTAGDWRALRELRLEALRDSPTAFLELTAEAELLGDDEWRARAGRGAVGGDAVSVLAFDGDRAVGMAFGYVAGDRGWLAAVYLAPAARGIGLLAELVEPVAGWLRGQGQHAVWLAVHEANLRAQAAYAKLGFRPTAERLAYAPDRSQCELVMTLTL